MILSSKTFLNNFIFMFSEIHFIFMLFETNFVFMLFLWGMLSGISP